MSQQPGYLSPEQRRLREHRFQQMFNRLSEHPGADPYSPKDVTESAYYKDAMNRYNQQMRGRNQAQLQQMGSSIHGGQSRALKQYQDAARVRDEQAIQAAAGQQVRADRAQALQEFQGQYDRMLQTMGFTEGVNDKQFQKEFQTWMAQQGIDRQESEDIMSIIGAGLGLAGTVGSAYLLGPAAAAAPIAAAAAALSGGGEG